MFFLSQDYKALREAVKENRLFEFLQPPKTVLPDASLATDEEDAASDSDKDDNDNYYDDDGPIALRFRQMTPQDPATFSRF